MAPAITLLPRETPASIVKKARLRQKSVVAARPKLKQVEEVAAGAALA
jgi:hypothetical protein